MDDLALVSFVVPVYGVANYLRACLDSLRAQTFAGFEAVLVDDGSTDGCAEICDEYAERDARFRVLHQPNGGRSAARNAGIEAARAKWIWFVDGDDQIEPDALEKLRPYLSGENDIIALGTGIGARGDAREMTARDIEAFSLLAIDGTTTDIPAESLWVRGFLFGSVTYRLFRRAFLGALRFRRDLVQSEDRVFFLEAVQLAKRIRAVESTFYIYVTHEGSISFRFTREALERNERLCLAVREIIPKRPEALNRYYCYVFDAVKVCLRLYFLHGKNPLPMREKRREFGAFIERPFIQEALKKCDWRFAGFKLHLFAILCRLRMLSAIRLIYRGLFQWNVRAEAREGAGK